MKTTVSYSPNAAKALGFLKRHQNDIDIYVEDSGNPNMWIKLLKKFLPDGLKLESVSVLGGRRKVLDACRANQNGDRPCLYIIDADLDLLLGAAKPRLKNLYRLRAYSIENYLLQPTALSEVATSFSPRVSKIDAERRIAIYSWLKENQPRLEKLFLAYAVSAQLDGTQETVGYSVHRLLVQGSQRKSICPQKVRVRVRQMYAELEAKHGRAALSKSLKMVIKNQRKMNFFVYVSAKDYVMPQIYLIMKREFGVNVSIEVFKNLLAQHVPAKVDPYLRRTIRQKAVS